MGAVNQVVQQVSNVATQVLQPVEKAVNKTVSNVSNAATQVLQPVEKAVSQAVTDVGKTIANNPALEGAITAIGAAYGVPPSITAAFLAANKTSQTGGNLEKGLETLVLSYGVGKLMTPVDLSTPAAIDQSVAQAQTAAQTQAAAEAQAAAQAQAVAQAQAATQAQAAAQAAAAAPISIADLAAVAPAASPAAIGTSLGDIGSMVGTMGAGGSTAVIDPTIAAMGGSIPAIAEAVAPAIPTVAINAGLPDAASFNQAVASGMSPGSVGAYESSAGMLNPEQLAAASGTTAAGIGALATPAAGISANQAVASGMSPGSIGAQQAAAGGLTAEQLAAAAGTTGVGSALNGLATAGNASSLTDLLNQGSSGLTGLLDKAGTAIGNTVSGLSGTQLAALGTGAAGLYNASATRQAMQDAIGAQQAATAASQGTLSNIYNQQLGYQAPYQAAGVGAANQLAGMTPYLTHQFNAADLQAGLAPNYDFMLQQGQQANQRAANVGGGALGGNALTGLNKYTQDYAGNAYQNAFNNYQSQRQNIYSDLAGIAGIGQNANVGAGTAGTNYGQGTVGLNTGLANAQAANILGQAQVGAGGVTNAANTAFLATLLGQNTPTAGTATTPGATSGFSLGDIAKLGSLTSGLGSAYNGIKSLFG